MLLMAGMAAVALVLLLLTSTLVVRNTAMDQLNQIVRDNLAEVDLVDGTFQAGENFHYYQNGVYILIYNKEEALLAGQLPVAFTAQEPFQNGVTRVVDCGQSDYIVLDLWFAKGWDNGLWVRGVMEAPRSGQTIHSTLTLAAVILPCFILLSGLGGFWIAKGAFRPLERITATAEAISEGADLAARMEPPKGNNELTRLTATFNQMFERLERSFESEKQFTADASHELRTPVSIIKGACEYAQKFDETPEERKETLEMIYRQALRMSSLITQLLSITRLDQGTELTTMEELDLSQLVQSACQDYPRDRLSLELEPGLTVRASAPLLTRLVQNLVDNGLKYGKEKGHVWVTTQQTEEEIELSVRDDGVGIPKNQQEKIWKRFYQVDPSRSHDQGAGLGLSMVQKIAQAHGGRMTVESVPNLGSRFTLHLPKKENEKNFRYSPQKRESFFIYNPN